MTAGAAAGLALGGAYLAGALARDADAAKAQRAMAAALRPAEAPSVPSVRLAVTPAAATAFRPSRGSLAERELDCLADAVYYEARGETPAGQAAIAQVVLNRVRHPAFPKSVCAVVFQGAAADDCQFSFACDGAMRRPKDGAAWSRAEAIAARAMAGYVAPQVGGATHFHAAGVDPDWSPNLMQVAQVGLHIFYRFARHDAATPTSPAERDVRTETPPPVLASMIPDLGVRGPQSATAQAPERSADSAAPANAAHGGSESAAAKPSEVASAS